MVASSSVECSYWSAQKVSEYVTGKEHQQILQTIWIVVFVLLHLLIIVKFP